MALVIATDKTEHLPSESQFPLVRDGLRMSLYVLVDHSVSGNSEVEALFTCCLPITFTS